MLFGIRIDMNGLIKQSLNGGLGLLLMEGLKREAFVLTDDHSNVRAISHSEPIRQCGTTAAPQCPGFV